MIAACPPADPALGMVRGLLYTVDCGVRVFAQGGYQALTQPPSPFPAIVTGILTLYVALIGWGMLSGRGPRLADTPQLAVKIAMIVALTMSWPLFQALVFQTAFDGAASLALVLTQPLRQNGSLAADLWGGLQYAYDQIVLTATALGEVAGPDANPLQGGPAAAAEGLWGASSLLIGSTLGIILTAKIVVGVLTAAGPIFIALFLLASTQGLFVGWLRALIAAALAPLAATAGLALLLALLEPRLATLAEMRAAGAVDLSVAAGVATLVMVFAAAQGALVLAVGIAGLGFALKRPAPAPAETPAAQPAPSVMLAGLEQTRAAAVADAVRRLDVRERSETSRTDRTVETRSEAGALGRETAGGETRRLGQTYRRINSPAAGGAGGSAR